MDLKQHIEFIKSELMDQYLYDENPTRPWIVGFSGGKDSTMLLQLVWDALLNIPPESRTRHIYVICNNTLVENPKILQYVNEVLKKIDKVIVSKGLPMTIVHTLPDLENSFWVNVIGRGYPAPNKIFRWCTERLKIDPTTRFIKKITSDNNEAIILLGTRTSESAQRAKSIKKFEMKGKRLRKHELPNTYVYAPIKDITTDEVWQYLMQNKPQWDANNKKLLALYKSASSGDCPLILDTNTPSCGASRFGCWTCTVVKRDKSMEGLIDSGEDWLLPLIEIREFLAESREKAEYREEKGRDGKTHENRRGPYYFWVRALILEKVLYAQKIIQEQYKDVELITNTELVYIQRRWLLDGYFEKFVSDIYNSVFEVRLNMGRHEEQLRKEEELLRKSCNDNPDDMNLIKELLLLQRSRMLLMRKYGLQDDIENRIDQFLKNQNKAV